MPKCKSKPTQPQPVDRVNDYGLASTYGPDLPQSVYDRMAFIHRLPIQRTGMTLLDLYKKIAEEQTPGFHEYHDWTNAQLEALIHNRWVAFAGCASSAKTHNVAGFAVNWWLMAPTVSAVVFASTTIKSLKKRGWARIQQAFQMMGSPKFGNFVDSRMTWQCQRGDDEHAVYGIAVEEGSTTKVADNLKGMHPDRLMIVLDEGTAIPEAIMDAVSNMWAGRVEFILVMMANPRSKLDQFGRFIEPKNGWMSVNVDTDEWETKPQMDGRCGICVRFDAYKSPNITQGRLISKYLPRESEVEAAAKASGGGNTPRFWSNFRGFLPPEGIERTVFSENALVRGMTYEQPVWTGDTYMVGGFDPAFTTGGDAAQFQPVMVGQTEQGMVAYILPAVVIPIASDSPIPASYQLATGLKLAAEHHEVPPDAICVDGTGNQVCDTIAREWSPSIQRIVSSWAASEREVSHENHNLACEVFANKRTEMWFYARELCDSLQLRGMNHDLASELCACIYEPEDNTHKRRLEGKPDMKSRIGKSPDKADALCLALEAARRKGLECKPQGHTVTALVNHAREVKTAIAAITENTYTNENYEDAIQEAYESAVW